MYSKQKKSNISGKWEQIGVASITEEDAKVLNGNTQFTGIKYAGMSESDLKAREKSQKKNEQSDIKVVKISDTDYDKSLVIKAINEAKFEGVSKINANTGETKVQDAYDALTEEQKQTVVTELNKEE